MIFLIPEWNCGLHCFLFRIQTTRMWSFVMTSWGVFCWVSLVLSWLNFLHWSNCIFPRSESDLRIWGEGAYIPSKSSLSLQYTLPEIQLLHVVANWLLNIWILWSHNLFGFIEILSIIYRDPLKPNAECMFVGYLSGIGLLILEDNFLQTLPLSW